MAITNYSLLTLTPSDDAEKKLFWKFRINSMQSQFQIYTAVLLISFLLSLANAVIKQESTHTWDAMNIGFVLTCQVIVILVSKRCTQRSITYLYPFMFSMSYIVMLFKLWHRQEDHREGEWTFEKHSECLGETVAILIGYLCYSTIFCPSLFFMLFVYAPIYVMVHMTYMYLRYDMNDDVVYFFNMRIIIVFVTQGALFFLLVQNKELSRFFVNQSNIKKESQVSNVLNS